MNEFGRRLGWGWLVVGGLVLLASAGFAIAHFVFGEPVYLGRTARLASDGVIVRNLLFIGGCGLFFAVMGWALVSPGSRR